MPIKSYVTRMPDKAGAFLYASRIIAGHHGNIVRASYNKAVDLNTFFLDVEASDKDIILIEEELKGIGYISDKISETRVIEVVIKIPDIPGAILPVLETLDRYDINISYINSGTNGSGFQNFKMGLLIENPRVIKMLLDEVSGLYQIDIIDCDNSEENLDNTVFYIRLANEMQRLMELTTEKTLEFISESNRILQKHQDMGENPDKVFDYIRRFAYFISRHRGDSFNAVINKLNVSGGVTLYSIQPPCGSNTYVLESAEGLLLVDSGYAVYAGEMMDIFHRLFPHWDSCRKTATITHADVDHCGLLAKLKEVKILLNQKSADSLIRQRDGVPDYREDSDLGFGYSKLSRIISGYMPPDPGMFEIFDRGTPERHDELLRIANLNFADLDFDVYEGSGGHLDGEMVLACRAYGLVFTGDILVNISGFSPETAEFNSLAPYLMRSVNVDGQKAKEMRVQIIKLVEAIELENKKNCLILGGHGPLSILRDGKMENMPASEKEEFVI